MGEQSGMRGYKTGDMGVESCKSTFLVGSNLSELCIGNNLEFSYHQKK